MNTNTSQTEENYLKAIFSLSATQSCAVSTNSIAERLNTKASSVTDMIKKLSDKKWVDYVKYQGVFLTKEGRRIAVRIIRKHRLWEVFLVKHLDFTWDEVHEVAEQLEHVKSEKLIRQLDVYLEHPTHDPHGDPIPDQQGNMVYHKELMMSALSRGDKCTVVGVKDSSAVFLKYLDRSGIQLGTSIEVLAKEKFDQSMQILFRGEKTNISHQISKNLFVKKHRS